jgi:hypothetical protein
MAVGLWFVHYDVLWFHMKHWLAAVVVVDLCLELKLSKFLEKGVWYSVIQTEARYKANTRRYFIVQLIFNGEKML